ncbi:MAG: ABC transporter ATP-binding protein [Bdellovibrionota bacterium]
MSAWLRFEGVHKFYGQKQVLNDVSFSVHKSEIIALLGVNGAGKTTAIKMMLGQEIPTSGTVSLFGMNPKIYTSRNKVGATPQNVDFPEGIKVREILEFVHGHYTSPHAVSFIVEVFELGSFLEDRASRLSGGQKRRLAIALAFIGNPDIIFLDEPTTGLDVGARKILWEFIKKESKSGKTIFLTTHYLEEIEQVASRVIFLQHGHIKIDGTVDDIKKIASSALIKVSFILENEVNFSEFNFCENYARVEEKVFLETFEPDNLLRELVQKNINFKNLAIERENLESAFLNLSK